MELLLLLALAGVGGYFLARSKFSKNIDGATGKVSDTSRELAGKAADWGRGVLKRNPKPAEEAPAEAASTPAGPEPPKAAEKSASRRKSEAEGEAGTEA
jgi:hypothetical protein